MSQDILIALGYRDVVPIAPRGGSDGGMDITFTTGTGGKGLACVTLRKDTEKKFKEDFEQRGPGEFEKYYFFCNSYLTASQKLKFASYCLDTLQAEFVPQDIEALRGLLDNALTSVRKQWLHIADERIPDLRFSFYTNEQYIDEIKYQANQSWHWQTVDTYLQQELDEKRAELKQMLARANTSVPVEEVQKFKKKYERYLADLEAALQMRFIKNYTPCCRLVFALTNNGTAPAQDLLVRLTFPKGSSAIYFPYEDEDIVIKEDLPDEPAIPQWAQPPIPDWFKGMRPLIDFSQFIHPTPFISVYPSFLPGQAYKMVYDSADFPFGRNVLTRECDKLGQHREWIIDAIIAYLPPDTKKGFAIRYEILADELPNPITGSLQMQWQWS